MNERIIIKKFQQGIIISLFFVVSIIFFSSAVQAKDINVGLPGDSVKILGDTLCLSGECKSNWAEITGPWSELNNNIYNSNPGLIGIGTSTPQVALDIFKTEGFRVRGPVAFTGSLYIDGGNRMLMVNTSGDVIATTTSTFLPAGILTLPTGVNGQTMRYNNGVWLGDSNLFNNGTNVGIGTTAPTTKLLVLNGGINTAGDSLSTPTAIVMGPNIILGTGISNGTFSVMTNDVPAINVGGSIGLGGRYSGTTQATFGVIKAGKESGTAGEYGGYLNFGTRAHGVSITEKMRITGSGNVGIGITAPTNKLHVSGGTGQVVSVAGGHIGGLNSTPLNADQAVPLGYLESNYAPIGTGVGSAYVQGGNSFGTTATLGTNDNNLLNIETNNAVRMTVATNGNVGIGTTNAQAKLEVAGSGIFSGDGSFVGDGSTPNVPTAPGITFGKSSADTNRRMDITSPVGGSSYIDFGVPGSDYNGRFLYSNSSNSLSIFTASSERMRINSSGNVGVGITNPTNKLHIDGGTGQVVSVAGGHIGGLNSTPVNADQAVPLGYLQSNYAPTGTGVGSAYVQGGNSYGTTATLGTNDNNLLNIETNNAVRMTIATNGNVGVGLTNPTSKLQIVTGGGISFAGQYKTYENAYNVNTATPAVLIDDTGAAFSVNKSYRVKAIVPGTGTETGAVAVFRGNGTTFTLLKNFEAGLSSNHIEFYLGVGGAPSVRLYSHASLYGVSVLTEEVPNKGWAFGPEVNLYSNISGNVGVGITPTNKFHISGGTGQVVSVAGGHIGGLNSTPVNADQAVPLGYLQSNYAPTGTGVGSAYVQGGNSYGTTATLGTNDNNLLNIETNNAVRMTIATNGNVGVGITNPSSLLEVYSANPRISSKRSTAAGNYAAFLASSDSLNYPRASFFIGDASGDSIVNAGLTVAPDVTSAVQKTTFLEVKTNSVNLAATKRFFMRQGTTNAEFITSVDNGNPAGAPLVFTTQGFAYTSPGIFISNAASQNVGIGITAPTNKLHIDGGTGQVVSVAGGHIGGLNSTPLNADHAVPLGYLESNYAPIGTGVGSAYVQGGNSFGTTATLGTNDNNLLNIETNNAVRMTVAANGNVGVGTTAPGSKVEITGGPLRLTATYLDINRSGSASSGISWYSQAFNAWANYMSPPGAGMGPKGNLTAPSGSLVTSWGLRSFIENVAGYGWTFESGVSSATAPAVKFEIRSSDGSFHSYGNGIVDGNLGVGITAPTNKLHVSGGTGQVASVAGGHIGGLNSTPVNSDHAVPLGYLESNYAPIGTGVGAAYVQGGNSFGTTATLGTNDNNLLNIETNNAVRMTVATNGNVGIATTAPGAKLDIISSENYTATSSALSVTKTGNPSVNSLYSHGIFSSNTLSGSANVFGYGVYGEAIKTGSFGNEVVGVMGAGRYNGTTAYDTTGMKIIGTRGHIQIDGNATAYPIGNAYSLYSSGIINTTLSNYYGLYLATPTGAGTISNKFAIYQQDSASNNYFASNVGIGTTAPGAKLDVTSSSGIVGRFAQTGAWTGSEWALYVTGYSNLGGYRFNAADGIRGIHKVSSGGVMGFSTTGDDPITFTQISSQERMRIAVGGNVGIGITAPTNKLHVSGGTGQVASVAGGHIGGLNSTPINADQAVPLGYLESNYAPIGTGVGSAFVQGGNSYGTTATLGTNDNNLLNIETNNSVRMTVATNGSVGIGTTNPEDKLQVGGGTSGINIGAGDYANFSQLMGGVIALVGGNVKASDTVSGQILADNTYAGGSAAIKVGAGEGIAFHTVGSVTAGDIINSERMRITTGGNVGIGITNPGTTLDVVSANANPLRIYRNSGNSSIQIQNDITSAYFGLNGSDNISLGFALDQSNAPFQINSSGNVGIGTSIPGAYKLKVVGDVAVTGTLVTQTGSDFAEEFATTYNLEPGTVVVMDSHGYKSVKPSKGSYDKTVVGIVSNNPSIIAGRVESEYKAIVAMMGVVKVKVSNINGRIYKGDMLTTSETEGYAMKVSDYQPGTIIGKALENLNGAKGEINVLVNLQ